MKQFQLTIVRQSRAILIILIFSLSILGALNISLSIENLALKILVPLLFFITINWLAVYYAYGKLTISAIEGRLSFNWTEKLLFNYSPIEDINIKDIKTIIIDKNQSDNNDILQAIITNDRKVKIGVAKYWRRDADDFISFLKVNTNAKAMDSWDVMKEKGYLKIAYQLTFLILLGGAGLITWVIIDNGFDKVEPHKWLMFIGSYLAFIPYWLVIKNKMKENRW